jgi:hypothetical protein
MVGINTGSHSKPSFHNEASQIAEQNRKSLASSAATHRSAGSPPNVGKVAMSSAQFVAIKLASSAAHLSSLSSTQYLIGVVLGELVGDFVLLILPVLPDSMAVEGANDADSRIPTMKKNFILMGVRMMMLMVREYP